MTTDYESTVRAALERFNAGDLDGYLDSLYVDDVALHYLPPALGGDKSGARLFYGMVMAGFPDVQVIPKDFIAENDRLTVRFTMTGTQAGEFMGVPPSGKSFAVTGITILRFANGKCVERWSETDMMGLMTQIGAVPA